MPPRPAAAALLPLRSPTLLRQVPKCHCTLLHGYLCCCSQALLQMCLYSSCTPLPNYGPRFCCSPPALLRCCLHCRCATPRGNCCCSHLALRRMYSNRRCASTLGLRCCCHDVSLLRNCLHRRCAHPRGDRRCSPLAPRWTRPNCRCATTRDFRCWCHPQRARKVKKVTLLLSTANLRVPAQDCCRSASPELVIWS
ncbi:hypothetical protein JKP88DRAFT_333046 [Tribonema minus]|uniref:Uncharacterized protein n=1 Tax=Tribonema minus TaxID=303371 RepID=A0A835YUG5_9STRA|nr:hypothetical protein JKP88DRAFT_333046 [Tribonema minus]